MKQIKITASQKIRELPSIGIIVPSYNEEDALPETNNILINILTNLIKNNNISDKSRIIYVDDGSKDSTWKLIENFYASNPICGGIKLTRNHGHQAALLCGIRETDFDATVSIDADLQDDVSVIEKMIASYIDGRDIVYGARAKRATDSFAKRKTAEMYYSLLKKMGVNVVYNHADFRLLSREATFSLRRFNEKNLFLRGIIPLLSNNSEIIYYDRIARNHGETKYTITKMFSLAWSGITALSTTPVRAVLLTGTIVCASAIFMAIYILYSKIFTNQVLPGWTSIVLPIYLLGGIQILCLGLIGEYIGKIYGEVKNRPQYLIEKVL